MTPEDLRLLTRAEIARELNGVERLNLVVADDAPVFTDYGDDFAYVAVDVESADGSKGVRLLRMINLAFEDNENDNAATR